MLLRVVVEETDTELTVVTFYKTSKFAKYERRRMKAEYDKETDTLTITLRDARVKESDEIRPGVIADFGYDGGVVGFEILQASKVVEKAGRNAVRSR
jgi:uncharacterized protein YuzE